MKLLNGFFEYETEEERENHIKKMEGKGYSIVTYDYIYTNKKLFQAEFIYLNIDVIDEKLRKTIISRVE